MIETLAAEIRDLPDLALAGVIFVTAVLVAWVIVVIGRFLLRRTEWKYGSIVLEEVYAPLYLSAVLVGLYTSSRVFDPANARFLIGAFSLTVVVILWTRACIRIGSRVIDAHQPEDETVDFGPIMENLLTIVLILFAFFSLFQIWQIDITPILASAGVLGIVLGYAARDSIANFIAGISLYFDRTFAVGDVIQLPSGERGTVVDISIRSTTVLTLDNITVTIPNSEFNSQQVTNESAPQRRRRMRLDVGVAYGSDLDDVEDALLTAAEQTDSVMDSPTPKVRFREFADSAITAQLQCHIAHPATMERARDELVRGINAAFKEHGIKIPFPQRELTFFEAGNTVRVEGERYGTLDGSDAED